MANIREYMKKREKTSTQERKQKEEEKDSFAKKLWIHRGKKIFSVVGLAVLAGALLFGYQYYRKNLIYTEYDVLAVAELTENINGEYKAYGDYILRYSMDGISCMDKNGALVWGQAYEIKNPVVDVCGNYVAVAALKGNVIYIFNKSGFQGEVKTQYPISGISVAGQGVVAVLMEDSGDNYIKLYDIYATELVTIKTSLEREGYPFAVAYSEDGKKLAVSCLNIVDNAIRNTIEFYNFSEVGQNYVEQMVGAYQGEFENSLVPEIRFINNNTVCAFADNQLVLFRMKEIPELITAIPIEEKIHAVFSDEAYIGLIIENEEEGVLYQLQVYTADGKPVSGISGKKLEQEYKNAFFAEKNLVLYNDYSCEIITMEGMERFNYTFDKNIVLIKHIADSRFNLVTPSSISEIRLK